MTARRVTIHVPIALGLTAATYAGSLALVTVLQAERDASAATAVAPFVDAGQAVRDENDRLTALLDGYGSEYEAAARAYLAAAPVGDRTSAALKTLADRLAALHRDMTGAAMPAGPAIGRMQVGQVSTSAPRGVTVVVHATTGASGH